MNTLIAFSTFDSKLFSMKILVIDTNHPLLVTELENSGHQVTECYECSYEKVAEMLPEYEGLVLRSRIPVDKNLIQKGKQLKFIARVGAGMENIDTNFAEEQGISLIRAAEGNADSVAEHALGMLLMLLHRLKIADAEVRNGQWKREENRGEELMGKTVGLIGYGVMGKAFATRLQGFGVQVLCNDLLENVGDENATQVEMATLFKETDVLSLHVPLTELTEGMVNCDFIAKFSKDFYLINTARGKCVKTSDLNVALESGKIKGACLDTLEHEKSSFETIYDSDPSFKKLLTFENVILSPHVAGWSHQSNEKLAQIVVDKINALEK